MPNHPIVPKRHRLSTGFLIAIFMGPLVAAHVLYAWRDNLNFKTTQTGTFLSPPLSAQSLPFFDTTFLGKWQLIYLRPKTCDTPCQNLMASLPQIHMALGKEKHRVKYRTLSANVDLPLKVGEIAIIDPQGWIIMHYPANSDLKGLLRDLRQLLRLSHVG